MELSKRYYLCTIFVILLMFPCNGCSLTGNIVGDWTDTRSLEEYGNQVAETSAVLKSYIGKHKDDIRMEFGEPHEVSKPSWLSGVEYEEEWGYCYTRGVIMINFERGCKYFFFKNDIVVAVDAS